MLCYTSISKSSRKSVILENIYICFIDKETCIIIFHSIRNIEFRNLKLAKI